MFRPASSEFGCYVRRLPGFGVCGSNGIVSTVRGSAVTIAGGPRLYIVAACISSHMAHIFANHGLIFTNNVCRDLLRLPTPRLNPAPGPPRKNPFLFNGAQCPPAQPLHPYVVPVPQRSAFYLGLVNWSPGSLVLTMGRVIPTSWAE